MDIGSGIAVGSGVLGGVAIAFKILTPKKNGNECHGPSVRLCIEHSGLVAGISAIKESQQRHETWLCEIAGDIKKLLMRTHDDREEDE